MIERLRCLHEDRPPLRLRARLGIAMLALLLVGAGASSALSQPAPSGTYVARGKTAADPPVRLRGHVLAQLPEATAAPFNAAAPEQQITLTVTLNRTDPVGFEAYVAGVVAGTNPTLGMNELTARFGPTPEAYQAVLDYLQQSGFSLVHTSSNRLTMTVRGTRARAEKAFAVTIRDYQLNGRTFFANDQDPAVPASIAGLIRGISGLNNLGIHKP